MTDKTQAALKLALEDVYLTIIQWDVGGGKRSRRELARRIVALADHFPDATKMMELEQQQIKQGWDVDTLLDNPKQPAQQQEPVAHCEAGPEYCPVCHKELNPEPAIYPDEAYEMGLEEVAFYTSPQNKPLVGLTHDEWDAWQDKHGVLLPRDALDEIEDKFKEKNNG